MMEKREVFLFGAGAVIDWKAPSTKQITTKIRESGFDIKNSNKKITDFIYQRLLKCGFEGDEITFETIINVIEELMVYNSSFNKSQTPSLLKPFFAEYDLSSIYNFSIKGGVDENNYNYHLQIPIGVDYKYSEFTTQNEKPNQFFLQHLINELLSEISKIVSDYIWDIDGNPVYKTDSKINLNFRKWFKSLNKDSVLRLYTLNYDHLFKNLLEQENINCFDGFDMHYSNNRPRPNVLKILSDTTSNIHYNLHGSVYWDVDSNADIISTTGIGFLPNNASATSQMEKGKTILVTKIITGYQKTQKSSLTPFRQLQSAFDKDCCTANKITIIGYSFNDEHINEALKIALRYNKDVYVEIIDPDFIKKEMDFIFALNIFPFINDGNMNNKTVAENEFHYFDGKLKVFTVTFSEYLEHKVL